MKRGIYMMDTFIQVAQSQPNEKSDTQKFWLSIFRDVLGIPNPEDYIDFEKRVEIDHIKFIDAYIPSTGTIIEQKSPGKDLDSAFLQAKAYYDWLPYHERGRHIITCDFNTFCVYDMDTPKAKPEIIPRKEVTPQKFAFLINRKAPTPKELREESLSLAAGRLAKKLYISLREKYDKSADTHALYRLNLFCVRIVFLLYAEDSGLFSKRQFHDYLLPRKNMARTALRELFSVLNTELPNRSPYIEDDLAAFPYVNGGLFEMSLDFPQLDDEALNIILVEMSEGFDWSEISPPIFGAIFESILSEEADKRRSEGIHYTSLENIHKVIDPLFLDDLNAELGRIMSAPKSDDRVQKLTAFQDKLASLRFLDPACGSGNFLTESFLSLRRMENKILRELSPDYPVKVSIKQFYGIEVNNFAIAIARTALWISSNQMWKELKRGAPLPLIDYDNIKQGSAMSTLPEIDAKGWPQPGWNIPHEDMLYIMGNPPFLGYSQQTPKQKEDVKEFFGQAKSDYVSCWFWKAAEYLSQHHDTKAAFVATNSIVQGEQPAYVFGKIRSRFPVKIEFAYQPFVWKNELPDPKSMAHVHVVIIAFSTCPPEKRRLYTPEGLKFVDNINFYLAEGPDEDIAVPAKTPVSVNALRMTGGFKAADGGNLIIKGEDYADFVRREPKAAKYIRRYMMGDDFINNKLRYCLWLVGAEPSEIRSMPLVYKRVKAVESFRLDSKKAATKKAAKTSWLFVERGYTGKNYLVFPVTSSEKRLYLPIGWLDDSVIPGNQLRFIPDATLYHFGVLTSRVHMAWMRRVCGRMKSDYSYSNTIVYNTFAWPEPSAKQRERIEQTAQGILSARAGHPGNSFADLYDDTLMPEDLRRAHERNDAAVCGAYGWDEEIEEEEIVRRLFVLYHGLSGK